MTAVLRESPIIQVSFSLNRRRWILKKSGVTVDGVSDGTDFVCSHFGKYFSENMVKKIVHFARNVQGETSRMIAKIGLL